MSTIPRTMTRSAWKALYASARRWYRGDWSAPHSEAERLVATECRQQYTPRGVYWEGYTAADSLRDGRWLDGLKAKGE